MAKFLEGKRSNSGLSDILHLVMNVGFAIAAVALVVLTDTPWFSLALVLAAKWRTFFVRPYFLWLSIRANLVGLIVDVSLVLLAYLNIDNYLVLLAIVSLFVLWTAILKAKTDLLFTKLQAGLALFLGLTVAVQLCYELPNVVLVAITSLIAYVAARHFLITLDEEDGQIELPALAFAFVLGALAFATSFWNVVYVIGSIVVPQLAVSALLLALFASLYLESQQKSRKVEQVEVVLAGVFAGLIQILMLVSFSGGVTY